VAKVNQKVRTIVQDFLILQTANMSVKCKNLISSGKSSPEEEGVNGRGRMLSTEKGYRGHFFRRKVIFKRNSPENW